MLSNNIRFLGSIYFAILLIALTTLFVIAGTFVESIYDSHRYAAYLTYGSPLFSLLLCGFFINILVSALRRWPFQKKHIPFLLTHLGLLMVLSGVLAKTWLGVQGTMTLLEGGSNDRILIADSYALQLENGTHKEIIPLKNHCLDCSSKVNFAVMGFYPHSVEKIQAWVQKTNGLILGLPPFPLEAPIRARFQENVKTPWAIIAKKTTDVATEFEKYYSAGLPKGELEYHFSPVEGIKDPYIKIGTQKIPLSGKNALMNESGIDLEREPTLLFLQDPQGDVFYFAFDPYGRIYSEVFRLEGLKAVIAYDNGYKGYAVSAQVPLIDQAPTRKELEEKALQGFEEEYSKWSEPQKKTLQWFVKLTEEINSSEGFLKGLEKKGWPLVKQLAETETKDEHEIYVLFAEQLFSIAGQLPDAGEIALNKLLYGYFKLLGQPIPVDYVPQMITIESPLVLSHQKATPQKKWEDNIPLLLLEASDQSGEDRISLAYDKTASGLKWPLLQGRYVARFQPMAQEIPYEVRLRSARQINYAQTAQPYSFEGDLIVTDKRSGYSEEKTISMNNVHETWDGYRFYLSSISPADESAVKRVQIVVNHDPAKYWLTYPGALVLTLGIGLLFWLKPYGKKG